MWSLPSFGKARVSSLRAAYLLPMNPRATLDQELKQGRILWLASTGRKKSSFYIREEGNSYMNLEVLPRRWHVIAVVHEILVIAMKFIAISNHDRNEWKPHDHDNIQPNSIRHRFYLFQYILSCCFGQSSLHRVHPNGSLGQGTVLAIFVDLKHLSRPRAYCINSFIDLFFSIMSMKDHANQTSPSWNNRIRDVVRVHSR